MKPMREILGCLLAAGILLLGGCGGGGGGGGGAEGKPTVVATIFAYYDILRAVGGDKVEAIILLPPKTTPHSYEPTVQAKRQVSRAKLIVKNGLNLDNWIDKLAADSPARVLNISKDVSVLQTTQTELGGGHEHGDAEHGAGNPHIWLDPRVQMAATEKVRDALIAIDPANKEAYTAGADKYLAELKQLDADFAAAAKGFKTREFIGFHTAYDYLAHRYGLVQVAALEEYPEQGVTPAQARKIIELIKEKHIKVIFNESALPSKDADLIVRETGVKVSVLQPLETYDSLSDTYVSLMRQNLKNLKEALDP